MSTFTRHSASREGRILTTVVDRPPSRPPMVAIALTSLERGPGLRLHPDELSGAATFVAQVLDGKIPPDQTETDR